MKTCKTCEQDKTLSEFYKCKPAKDGKSSSCKECSKAYSSKYRLNHPKEVKRRTQAWKKAHKKELAEYQVNWKEANPDKVKKNSDDFRFNNPEKVQSYRVKHYKENKEIIKEKVRAWRKNNPDKKRQQGARYLARKRNAVVGVVDIPSLLAAWDKACGICTEPVEDQYHIDHIMPLSKGGKHCQDNLQLTHPVCNIRKGNKVLV